MPWQEILRWRSFEDVPDEEMRVGGSRVDLLAQKERKCSAERSETDWSTSMSRTVPRSCSANSLMP